MTRVTSRGAVLRVALVFAVATAGSAMAQRISLLDFTGPGAAAVRQQLVSQVCDTADCVAAAKVTTSAKPDLKKAKKENVSILVSGVVAKKGKASNVDLTVTSVAKGTKSHKVLPLEPAGTLSAKNLQAAVDLMNANIGGSAEPSTPDVKPTPPVPVANNTPPPTTTKPPEKTEEPPPEVQPARPEKSPAKKPMFLAVEVGTDLGTRSLDYVQAATPNLRAYTLGFFPLPGLKVEFYPLALMRTDFLSGLGIDAGLSMAPFLKSRTASGTDTYPTNLTRIDVGLRWRIMPVDTFALAVIPYVGLRLQSFTVGAASSGTRLDGLPNISYTGLRAGIALEVPLVKDLLVFFGRFGVVPVFSSGEIISSAYFQGGSTFGLEANAGLGVQLISMLQVRASFEYSSYSLTFKTQPTDQYVAVGASDRLLGGNVSVRLQF